MTRFSEQIKMLIASNKTAEALSILSETLKGKDETTRNDVILLQAKYKHTESNYQKGIIRFKKASSLLTRINNATLTLLIDLDTQLDSHSDAQLLKKHFPEAYKEYAILDTNIPSETFITDEDLKNFKINLYKWGLVFLVLLLIIVYFVMYNEPKPAIASVFSEILNTKTI